MEEGEPENIEFASNTQVEVVPVDMNTDETDSCQDSGYPESDPNHPNQNSDSQSGSEHSPRETLAEVPLTVLTTTKHRTKA